MTRRREVTAATAGLAVLAASIFAIRAERLPVSHRLLQDRCATPVSVIEPDPAVARAIFLTPQNEPLPSAIVLHGLSGNRRIMYSIGQSLAQTGLRAFLIDSPGEGDSTGQFSFAAAESCAVSAIRELQSSGEISMPRTMLIGHSLGGAIAVRLADDFPEAAGTIAISPAPLIPPRHVPANVLIASAQFDPPQLVRSARELLRDLHGARAAPEDFAQRRAVGFQSFAFAMHTSVLTDPRVEAALNGWSQHSLLAIPANFDATHEIVALLSVAAGVLGIAAMVPPFATTICALFGGQRPGISSALQSANGGRVIAITIVAAVVAAGSLMLGVPLRALHLYSADYLASFISLTGLLLLALLPREMRGAFRGSFGSQTAALVFGLAISAAFAAWLNWQMADLWPNMPRWLLMLPLAAVIWPYFAAEELALGALGARSGRARWLVFIAMRGALLVALILGYFGFHNGEFLPVLISPALGLLSICQRAASDTLQSRTRSLAAAATLDAILAAWFLAAVFPLR